MRSKRIIVWPHSIVLVVLLAFLVPQAAAPLPALLAARGPMPMAAGPTTVTFQQGVSGYAGAVDTFIASATPTAANGAAITITVDGSPLQHVLIRFDGIIGNGAGQVPPGATIQSATLSVNVTNVSANAAGFHRMLQSWSGASTWDSLVGGVQANGTEAVATPDVSSASSVTGQHSVNVTASVAAWAAGAVNLGWALLPGGTDGWGFESSEAATAANRPRLSVTYTTDRAPDAPTGPSPANGATGVSTNPTLCVDVDDPDNEPLTVTFRGRPAGQAAPEDFTIIAMPDTQFYAQTFASTFTAQTQWIVDNRLSRNIRFVTQLGDCTNDGNTIPVQWTRANDAFSLLENPLTTGLQHGIPFGIAVGNHDQTPAATARSGANEGTAFGGAGGTFGGTTQFYNQTFGAFRFEGRGYFGDNYDFGNASLYADSMDNHYELFSAGGMEFIAFHLEWDDVDNATRQAVLAWMHNLLATTYANRRAMLTAHYFLNTNGTFSNQGQATFDTIRDLPNVFLMLSGHLDQASRRAELANDGHTVNALMSDYQTRPNGGNGWLRIMTFSPANDTIHVQTYSPTIGQFINNHVDNTAGTAQNEFTLSYDMDSGTPFALIGTATGVPSGGQACVSWPGRTTGQVYEWRAEVTDGELTTTGPNWTFTASCASNAQCDDASACTVDTCNAGSCEHTPVPGCCAVNADCADPDPCTNDVCNLSNNTCQNTAIDCNDGSACTGPDVCSGGVCQNPYTPFAGCCTIHSDCDDGIPATTDTCNAGTCSNLVLSCLTSGECNDGDPCTTDSCSAANLQSLVLDGTDDHVDMGAAAGLNASPAFTVEAWINGIGGTGVSTGTQGLSSAIPLVAKGTAQAETPANFNMNYFLGLDVEGSGRRLAADFEDAATGLNHAVCSSNAFPATGWHHVAATYSPGNGWRLYVDGVSQPLTTDNTTCTTCIAPNCTTTPGATPEPNSIQHFGIGASLTTDGTVNGRYQGKIDEVRVWNVERNAAEIANARDEMILAAPPDLLAHYGFDDSTANDSTTPAENGTLSGAPVFDSVDRPEVGGACVYEQETCDDADPCTTDVCISPDGCQHIPANDGGACNDGNGCTIDDICTSGVCGGTSTCDDHNACTGTDQCVANVCQNPYTPTPGCCTRDADCDDSDPGTDDACTAGTCSNVSLLCTSPADCDDGDSCTTDTCNTGNVSALNFDGSNDYVTMGAASGPGALGAVDFTLETWIRRDGASWGTVASTGNGGVSAVPLVTKGRGQTENSNVDANYFLGITTAGVLVADFEQAIQGAGGWNAGQNHPACGTATIADQAWHHVAVTYAVADGWHLYLDGVEGTAADATACTTCNPAGSCPRNPGVEPRSDSIQHFGLGTAMNSDGVTEGFFGGTMDEVRVWNRALSPAEIQSGMDQEVTSGNDLLGRWGLDENAGPTAGDSTNPAQDGTLNGGPAWIASDKAPLATGTCMHTPIQGCAPCTTAAQCDDGNPCTNDACSPGGACVYTNNNAPCASDGNACTDDVCSGGACTHPNDDGNACADANTCTADACVGGACLSWYAPAPGCCDDNGDCNDGHGNTTDTCSAPSNGTCANTIPGSCASGAVCDDGNSCTADACSTTNLSALNFDGTNDSITMGTALGLGSAAFTLEGWIRRDGASWGATASTGTGGITGVPLITKGRGEAENSNVDANYFFGITTAGRLVADFEQLAASTNPTLPAGQNRPICSNALITDQNWHHVAVTYDKAAGAGWRFYIDGVAATAADGTQASCGTDSACTTAANCPQNPGVDPRFDSVQHFGLGTAMTSQGATQGFFGGVMDEVRVWGRALGQTEIQNGMNQAISSGTALLGRWGLDQGSGTTATDSTAPAEHGTLTESTGLPVVPANGPAWSASDKAPVDLGICSNTPIPGCASCTADYQCGDANGCTTDACSTSNDAAVSLPSPAAVANRVDLALGSGSNAAPDYVNFFGTGSFTIEGWVYTDGGAASLTGIFRGGQQGAFPQVVVQLTGTGNLQVAGSVESNVSGTQVDVVHPTALVANTWTHFALVVDRTTGNQQLRLHLNGGAPTSAAATALGTNPVSFASQSMIGAARLDTGAVGLPFDGRLDEIRIWNYARTQAETAADMNREIATAPGLAHRWSFNEGTLVTAADSAGGITGTLAGAATWSTTGLPVFGSDSCTHATLANGTSCSDGNACTAGDTCQAGACAAGAAAPAGTACGSNGDTLCDNPDTCNGAGVCLPRGEPNGTPCADATVCNGSETCQNAFCTAGTPLICADDGNPCTDQVCNASSGCQSIPNTAVVACYTGPAGTLDVGACHAGTATCSNGLPGACAGEVTPASEVCDAVDNDCDGLMNEGTQPLEAQNLVFQTPTSLAWTASPGANAHVLYRGTRSNGVAWSYNEVCLESALGTPAATDAGPPALGEVFFYFSGGRNGCGFATIGVDSAGQPRPAPPVCP
jgi:concanavalin A-like lectin/glucanase superfamily protein/slime mold repeat-containing protein